MSVSEKLGKFIIFVLLTIITFGFYLWYFMVTMTIERNQMLKKINANLEEIKKLR